MKRASAVMICMVCILALFNTVPAADYSYTALDYPGAANTEAWGINNTGVIVGWYDGNSDSAWDPHGFFLNGSTWTGLDYPGAMWTFAMGINDSGSIVGTYLSPGGVAFGYSLTGGTYTHIDSYPSADENYVYAINGPGTMVGWFSGYRPDVPEGLRGYYGFSLSGTTYTLLDYPDSLGIVFHAYGINDGGTIVGQCVDFDGTHCCCLSGPTLAFLDRSGADSTVAWGINNNGTIVGEYTDAAGTHGFSLTGTTWTTLNYPGAYETVAHGVNDSGSIVGYFTDSTGTHGFLATPVPDPMSVAIDIRPWSNNNSISYRGWGLLPVAILGSGTFDAFQATDLSTITFGHSGTEDSMVFCSPWDWDVNSDGYADLLCFFSTNAAHFQCGDTQATFKGMTRNGTALTGQGPVRIVSCRAGSR